MTNYIRRMIWVDEAQTQRVNFLVYPFLLATLAYGIGFTFFSWSSGVQGSSLWQAFNEMGTYMPHIWGALCLVAGVFAAVLLLFRKGTAGEIAAMFGYMVWLFAAWTYADGGFWLPLASVVLPNLMFWTYYYFRVKNYERMKKYGRLVDVA